MSVVALLVVIALAAGVGCGFLLVRPQSLRSSTASGSITAAKSRFDDARDVTVTVHTGTGRTVASPKSGTITAYGCAPGQTIDSGTSFIAVDEVPLLSLHTAVPPFRDLQSGMRGRDVAALNAELRRLGYAAPDGDAMTWDTILAYNALADTVGAARLVKDNGWTLAKDAYVWLDGQSVTIRSCVAGIGASIDVKSELLTTDSQSQSVSVTMPQDEVVAGDRVLDVNGRMVDMPQQTTAITDSSTLAALLGSDAYRQASGTAESSESASDGASDVTFTLQWLLKTPIDVWSLPPTAFYAQHDEQACVVSDGKPVAVTVIGSRLGRSMATVDSGVALGQSAHESARRQAMPMSDPVDSTGPLMKGDDDRTPGKLVTLRDVGHTFTGDTWLFRSLNADLRPDRVYALVGPSGSGKSTLLSILAGWVKPSEGSIQRLNIGKTSWVFQNPIGVARRSVIDHVTLPYLARGLDVPQAEACARELLAQFGLAERASSEYRELSGGEAQRLMLARGVASGADLLLVDEPTAQLDVHTADTVNARLGALSRQGMIVVVATHDHRTRDAATDVIDLEDYQ